MFICFGANGTFLFPRLPHYIDIITEGKTNSLHDGATLHGP
jgi:hypothetical protein